MFKNFTGKHLCSGLRACNFIKKRFQHRCLPVKSAKFLRILFFTEHLQRLLLNMSYQHCVEIVQIRSFSSPCFPVFGLNMGKCGPENSVLGHFQCSVVLHFILVIVFYLVNLLCFPQRCIHNPTKYLKWIILVIIYTLKFQYLFIDLGVLIVHILTFVSPRG